MLGALALSVLLVVAVDQTYGHSTLAFAAAIALLLVANAPMLRFNCGRCGKNVFFRGPFVVPWPNRVCTRCGHDLDAG
jgi:ribosomal protein S27AE